MEPKGEGLARVAVTGADPSSLREGAFEPEGRFSESRVLDKKLHRNKGEGFSLVAFFMVEIEGARNRLVFLEQRYAESEDLEEPILVEQYASVGNELIFNADPREVDPSDLEEYLNSVDGFISRRSRLTDFVQIRLRSPTVSDYISVFDGLRQRFPNTIVSRDDLHFTSAVPSEFSSALQWHLDQIKAPDAWEFSKGGEDTVVAVIDTGCFVDHPDLVDNIFVNTGEIAGNGIDDDGNGFVDDVSGWDFLDDDALPNDETGHGTHVSGIVGARGDNGVGTTGVGWNIKVLPLKVGDSSGLSSSAIAEALRYVSSLKRSGINIVATNNSYGSSAPNNVARAEIQVHEDIGVLFVAAAGNAGEDIDASGNSQFPAGFTESNILSVANSTQGDDLSFGSNYGVTSVDIAAPGQEVYSTYRDGDYEFLTGTSMASPIVAGAIALLASHEPSLTAAELRQRILDTAEPMESLDGKVMTGGRLDLLAMLEPSLMGHTLDIPNHDPHLVLLPRAGFRWEFEVRALSDAEVSVTFPENEQDVSIEETGSRSYSVSFAESGVFRMRIRAEKQGIVREAEKVVVVGSGASNDVVSGLVHSWEMQGSGTVLEDRVGTGDGEFVGATRIDTPLGRGIDFDGSASFARFNATFSPEVTLSAFVKSDDLLSSPHPRIINLPDYYLYFSTRGISDLPDGNANTLKFYSNRTGDFGVWNSPPDTVLEGEWMHVLASYDSRDPSNTPRLFINGEEQSVRLQRIPVGEQTTGGGEAYLGDRADGDRAWDGQMDEVRVYGRAIDETEVSVLAARYASAFWEQYSILVLPESEGGGTVSLTLADASGVAPVAQFQWYLAEGETPVSLEGEGESAVIVLNPENANITLVLKATSSMATRYFEYDLISRPPVVDPGVYTGTTSQGGTVWLEVETGNRSGAITIIDAASSTSRIREPVLIDAFGAFETNPVLPFKITGSVDGMLTGEIEDSGLQFTGENIEPSSVVDGFAGFYAGGVVGKPGQTLEVRVFESGEALVWRAGFETELLQGMITPEGELELLAGDGSILSGTIDAGNGTMSGAVTRGEEVNAIYLRQFDSELENRYVNLSTRGLSSTGENVLIGGFVLVGSQPRTVLVRGIGPDLADRGVDKPISDPSLRLFNGSELIAENEDWGDVSNLSELVAFASRAGASPLQERSLDAGLLMELDPGLYTVFLESKGEEGVGLFEVFDDPTETNRSLFNVSTRGRVLGETSPLIAGFVVTGPDPKPVLIRALGPALASRGVSHHLEDPRVAVYSGGVKVAENDDWSLGSAPGSNGNGVQGPARALIRAFEVSGATGLEFESKDAALLIWLEPGLYTAIAGAPSGSEGIALVEVFEVD